ncbi:MAG: bifunctional 5,10-methylenetetrahydrofolate dehydrogenase/5,10-methenyltetrahydrofolate cyclohydrolase [Candidatus Jorgensenbacteria bacterium]|nr:bifunctional 5,10-methylenetetrahydrofolate dehydrogenase/5,10-methenyltetrahydrofolate cyclohydrolase [Candidatus Jorgensenbacteria bacterium]
MIIDGKRMADGIIDELKKRPDQKKFLAAILVGDDPGSIAFLRQKEKVAEELDIEFQLHKFPERVSRETLRRSMDKITGRRMCGGLIVQLPLPSHINMHYILNAIPREEDTDVLSERALGSFYAGRGVGLPPAVGTLITILASEMKTSDGEEAEMASWHVQDKKVAVVGLGFLVGRPIATWLIGKSREAHFLDKGSDFSVLQSMDIVILGTGHAHLVNAGMFKKDALVIDFGYARKGKDTLGDFDPTNVPDTMKYTPTPGGTGPILVARLFKNFYDLNK